MSAETSERRQAAALDARIIALIEQSSSNWSLPEDLLNPLALDIFAYQYEQLPPFRRYADARGAEPGRIDDWRQIPPVPVGIFKRMRYAAFPASATRRCFRSSGTGGGHRSTLELDTLALYDAALMPPLERFLFPDHARLPWLALLPDPALAPDSSLAYMVGQAATRLARTVRFLLGNTAPEPAVIAAAVDAAARSGEPICLLGTAFAFVHLLDYLRENQRSIHLATGSRLMETGGFKGQSRVVERTVLYTELCQRLGLRGRAVVGEYGMCEMGSQFYDESLRAGLDDPAAPRIKQPPPWVRTRVVDPTTLEPVATGRIGLLVQLDLTGRGTTLVLETEDLGRRVENGFELCGRLPGAEPRGCSLAYDAFLRISAEN